MHKIIEASETLDGRLALTIEWPCGAETAEIVSGQAAKLLGYAYPGEELEPEGDIYAVRTDYLSAMAGIHTDSRMSRERALSNYDYMVGLIHKGGIRCVELLRDGKVIKTAEG